MTDAAMDSEPLVEEVDAMEAEVAPGPMVIREEEPPAAAPKPVDSQLSGDWTWRIENYKSIQDVKLYSEKFEIGTYMWRLLVFPRGNKQNYVSAYLDSPEAAYTPPKMYPKASFKLIVRNFQDPTRDFAKEASHTFTAEQTDWGFTQLLPLQDLDTGFLDARGAMELRVEITLQRDNHYAYDSRSETGHVGLKNQGATCYMNSLLQYLYAVPYFRKAVYHMPVPEDEEPSKSLPVALQSLFYKLQYSTSAVATKDLTKSFGWGSHEAFMQHDIQELNRVLCEKLEEKMKGTKVEKVLNELFEGALVNYMECINVDYKSTRRETFMDLSLDVKGCGDVYASLDKFTEVEVLMGDNQWKTDTYGLQDARKGILFENFPPVLQLQLKRFDYDYARDMMVKINDRYEFPDVLDLDHGNYKYHAPHSDRSVRNEYRLHSVLVHSGGVHGGHYYAFIRPDGKQWLRFDDDKVYKEEHTTATVGQFGGDEDVTPLGGGMGPIPLRKAASCSNAYMLVYVRIADWERIMCSVTKDDIADHLRTRLEQEQREKEQRQRDKAEAHQYCTIRVVMDQDIEQQVGRNIYYDLVDFEALPKERVFRLPKKTKLGDFKAQLAQQLGAARESQRLWTWQRRQNGTMRPNKPVPSVEDAKMLCDLRDYAVSENAVSNKQTSLLEFRFYLETAADGNKLVDVRESMLLFVKFYEPTTETITFDSRIQMYRKAKGKELVMFLEEQAAERLGEPSALPIDVYEEVKTEPTVIVTHMTPRDKETNKLRSMTLKEMELEDGDVLVVQRSLESAHALGCRLPSAEDFFTYIRNRRLVRFKRIEEPKEEGFQMELDKDMNYDQVVEAVAAHLGHTSDEARAEVAARIRLTQTNFFTGLPQRQHIRYRSLQRLENMLVHGNHATSDLYYELLDMPLEQMEQLKTLKVAYYNDRCEPAGEHTLRLPRDATVAALLHQVAAARAQQAQQQQQQGGDSAPSTTTSSSQQQQPDHAVAMDAGRQLRLLEIINSKIFKVIPLDTNVDSINDTYWQLRVEQVPLDQMDMGVTDRLLHVQHVTLPDRERPALGPNNAQQQQQDTAAAVDTAMGPQLQGQQQQHLGTPVQFGEPFLFCVNEGETLLQVKARIQAKLGVSAEEFAKWEFIGSSLRGNPHILTDNDPVLPYCLPKPAGQAPDAVQALASAECSHYFLGLVHEEKGPRRGHSSHNRYTYERPVKIYG